MRRPEGELGVTPIEEELFGHIQPLPEGDGYHNSTHLTDQRSSAHDGEGYELVELELPRHVREAVDASITEWRHVAMWPGWRP